jgi:hypothetical protein
LNFAAETDCHTVSHESRSATDQGAVGRRRESPREDIGEEAGKSPRSASGPGERRGKEEGEELGSAKGHEMKRPAALVAAIVFWLIALRSCFASASEDE